MESMVERVARAIALESLDPETRAAVDPEKWFVADSYYGLAKAAIEATRGPTDTMKNSTYMRGWEAAEIWEAMIDAALKEYEEGK